MHMTMLVKTRVRKMLLGSLVALGVALVAGDAQADLIDFSVDGSGSPIFPGQIIDDEFLPLGLTIEADNFTRAFDWAIIFDSANPTGGDSDLGSPGTVGNASTAVLGHILILSERGGLGPGGLVAIPDDEGERPAGTITFRWAQPITQLGYHLIDVENDPAEMSGFFRAFSSGGIIGTRTFADLQVRDPSIVYGNNSINRITPLAASEFDATSFDEVVIRLGGSGAIDTLVWQAVPEPPTLWLVGVGAAVCLGMSRRRRRRHLDG